MDWFDRVFGIVPGNVTGMSAIVMEMPSFVKSGFLSGSAIQHFRSATDDSSNCKGPVVQVRGYCRAAEGTCQASARTCQASARVLSSNYEGTLR